jgi:NNP family nitrate/nitrite transporter-like MFS transporter
MHATLRRGNHRITDFNPEDTAAWEAGYNRIARRNLLRTVAGDHVAFSIWSLWSVMALFMAASGYGFSTGDKLLPGTVATLVDGCVRIPYTLGIAAFGGRNWTTYWLFLASYVVAALLTWIMYVRRPFSAAGVLTDEDQTGARPGRVTNAPARAMRQQLRGNAAEISQA